MSAVTSLPNNQQQQQCRQQAWRGVVRQRTIKGKVAEESDGAARPGGRQHEACGKDCAQLLDAPPQLRCCWIVGELAVVRGGNIRRVHACEVEQWRTQLELGLVQLDPLLNGHQQGVCEGMSMGEPQHARCSHAADVRLPGQHAAAL